MSAWTFHIAGLVIILIQLASHWFVETQFEDERRKKNLHRFTFSWAAIQVAALYFILGATN